MGRPKRRQRKSSTPPSSTVRRQPAGRFTARDFDSYVPLPPLPPGSSQAAVRERQCGDKVRYSSESLAKNTATAMNWTGRVVGPPVDWYLCRWCSTPGDDGWHIGHNSHLDEPRTPMS